MSELEIPGLQILNVIGQGGMATVYLALQESLRRPVAVKVLNHPDISDFHDRFLNEGRYIAALSHSNIIKVYDIGESHGRYHIIMEYLSGGDLKQKIRKGIRPVTALKLVAKIAGCLDYLHGQGLVHRDLKPSNILFREDGSPVITDFGIAKLLQDNNEVTLDGSILGSPHYLSPEQADASVELDGRSDLYSLGVILFEMLSGRHPFTGEGFAAVVMAHREAPIPRLPDQHARYQSIIDHLLAKRPEDRYPDGQALVRAIHEVTRAEVHPLPGKPVSKGASGRSGTLDRTQRIEVVGHGGKRLLLLSVVAGLAVAGGWYYLALPTLATVDRPTAMVHRQPVATPVVEPVVAKPALVSPPVRKKSRQLTSHHRTKARQKVSQKPRLNPQDQLFRLAYARMDALRFSQPEKDNALYYFHKILDMDPDNQAARAGIRQILRWYTRHAEQALREGKLEKGRRYVERGLAIKPRSHQLRELRRKLRLAKYGLPDVLDLSSVFE